MLCHSFLETNTFSLSVSQIINHPKQTHTHTHSHPHITAVAHWWLLSDKVRAKCESKISKNKRCCQVPTVFGELKNINEEEYVTMKMHQQRHKHNRKRARLCKDKQ